MCYATPGAALVVLVTCTGSIAPNESLVKGFVRVNFAQRVPLWEPSFPSILPHQKVRE